MQGTVLPRPPLLRLLLLHLLLLHLLPRRLPVLGQVWPAAAPPQQYQILLLPLLLHGQRLLLLHRVRRRG